MDSVPQSLSGADPLGLGRSETILLWDLDGTIIDSRRDLAAAVNRMLVEFGYPPLTLEQVIRHVGGGARNLVARALAERTGSAIESESADRALAVFRRHYDSCLLDTTRPYGKLGQTLRELANRGRRMAVVSNKPQRFTARIVEGLGLTGCFRAVFGEQPGLARKPDPAMLQEAERACRRGKGESDPGSESRGAPIMIGDSLIDLEAARRAGMPICGVGWGIGSPEAMLRAGPDQFAHTPEVLDRWLLDKGTP